ncbi:GTPase-activating protein gyp8 [Emydomyces testavorans]|uniref:GTPase-activating protein gyp8 n=1 Tax=Emydomyces testavorans TaxID=2070801 RepID=A0AAF0II13_9EURO|nr:GTPase-activating protein gyp8 [Emydomyces testavorans]
MGGAKEPDEGQTDENSRTNGSIPSLDSLQPKKDEILRRCEELDVESLIALATSEGGLLHDDLRKLAWPILLGYDREAPVKNVSTVENLPKHGDEGQVKLDVNRAFIHYPNYKSDKQLESKKDELFNLIISILRGTPMLCYFQGFHDIAQVLLLVLGPKDSVPAIERISLFRIRDYMLPSLAPAVKHLQLLPALLHRTDVELFRHLSGTQPFFALAATLTLYAHDIQEYSDIARLYDFILSHEPVVSIYLFASVILSRRKELLEIPVDEPEMMHFTLSKLPQPLDLEMLISNTMELYKRNPPETLPFRAWRNISRNSVLKTSRDLALRATASEAEALFEKQTRELRRDEKRRKGDLGHTDLQEDLEFHNSNFNENPRNATKSHPDSTPFLSGAAASSSRRGTSPGGTPSKHRFWTLSYYAQYFDVDTSEVFRRCTATLYPRSNFLDVLDGNPDLYGPFWIATTVVVILFLTGTISQYLAHERKGHFEYDFRLLSGAAGLVYGYTGVIPIALWGALRWFGSSSADLIECWALYGYANLIWIAVALVSWSPLTALNWVLVGVGFGWTVFFLLRNLYPVLSTADTRTSKILLVLVIVLHAGLALAIKVLFFAHGSPAKKGKDKSEDDKD